MLIDDFCRKHKKIYIYGAGKYGRACSEYVSDEVFAGFVSSSGEEIVNGVKVCKYADIESNIERDTGIIIAMTHENQLQVLQSVSFNCDTLCVGELELLKCRLKEVEFSNTEGYYLSYTQEALKKILVIQIEVTYGDVIWASAFLRSLRESFDYAQIDMVINQRHEAIIQHCPYINNIYKYDKVQRDRRLSKGMIDDITDFYTNNLLGQSYDAVFLVRHIPFDDMDLWENILLMELVDAKYRFGHVYMSDLIVEGVVDYIRPFFTRMLVEKNPEHVARQYVRLLETVNVETKDIPMEMWVGQDEKQSVDKLLSNIDGELIGIVPVGSTRNRAWNPEYFVQVIRELKGYNSEFRFVILGGSDAEEAASVIKNEVDILDLTGKTSLLEASEIIRRCRLYIGVDTGLMQMASANGVPIVEISHIMKNTPKSYSGAAEWTGPYCVKNIILKPEKGLEDCKYVCRHDSHCINQISPEDVVIAAKELLT
ncbi:glycosyltransferase family 9 protein [Butyrivibrio fibrisolvens]|uniref:glycosyltransferase family 9 protein n=1 Tax=Pseudobutyrivibrio ruminis TaxID=46206 RepID=UPI0004098374|nr:glycosyltransferase family 9 protein [Pseudobutyrivibrio ruminis]MDC7279105.1 glycosyltransferase family 9 protein [Butyrivibrio fibrisolvens]